MRFLVTGLMMTILALGTAFASDGAKSEVTGLPLYEGPMYRSLDSKTEDIAIDPQFHAFHHRGVDEVGFSPLTLEDFRLPVPGRVQKEFNWERLTYPDNSRVVWHDDCNKYTVSAFFFTRDMVRDHIQTLIDAYYVCDPDVVQQMIDYYAEVTPQSGEAISWVWFSVDEDKHDITDLGPNRYFERYLANFKDKFYLEFGLPKAQSIVDDNVHEFLYNYQRRGKFVCGPELHYRACGDENCDGGCAKCTATCKEKECNVCREKKVGKGDEALYCQDYKYHGFSLDLNENYVYYPRKVVIEDITYDHVARAYRWKFAWRFNDCEINFLREMCHYGEAFDISLVLSDPTWYAHAKVDARLKRNILASMDPTAWGNVWPASNLPMDMSCCPCGLPTCDGNCSQRELVDWDFSRPAPPNVPETPANNNPPTKYEPPQKDKETDVVPGKG